MGSTGSIGTQALDIIRNLGFSVPVLAAYGNIRLLEEQIREFRPKIAAVYDEQAAKELKGRIRELDVKILAGREGLLEAAEAPSADIVLNSVVGMVGLEPTLAAISAGKDIALANKETLVAGGALVMKAAKEKGIKIYPVDSEHSAIFQCLQGAPGKSAVQRLILTASGGPFFGKTREELETVGPEQALKHPNWSMGTKITIDSATMMNKGLEIIEAAWLFDMPEEKIDVLVHRESVIHSMVEFSDNSVIAQLGVPDMRVPIQYALTYPERSGCPVQRLRLEEYGKLTFYPPDTEVFSCMPICREALRRGGLAPAAVNGANEEAVALFLKGKIGFLDIPRLVRGAMQQVKDSAGQGMTLGEVLQADETARNYVQEQISV